MSASLIIVNSKNRSSGTSSSFYYNLNFGGMVAKSFRLNKVVIPYSWYNIPEQNIEITINGGAPITVLIAGGSYNAQNLAAYLQTQLSNAASPLVFTVVYNTAQNTFTITLADNIFTLLFTYPIANYNLGNQLGIGLTTSGSVGTITSLFAANLNATSCVNIRSNTLRTSQQTYFLNRNEAILQTVPVNVNSFNYIVWQNSFDTIYPCDRNAYVNFDFTLLDDSGNVIDLRGADCQFEIQFFR
jgi:hypothetical protein